MSTAVLGLELGAEYFVAARYAGAGGRKTPALTTAVVALGSAGGEEAALDSLLRQLHWRRGRVILGVEPGICSLRCLHLPFTAEEAVSQIIGQELADQFPRPLEELLWDSRIVRRGSNGCDILAAALPREWLHRRLALLQSRDITVEALDLGSMALASLAARHCPKDSVTLLADLVPGTLTLALLHEGEPRSLRELPWPPGWSAAAADITPAGENTGELAELCRAVSLTLTCWRTLSPDTCPAPAQLLPGGRLAESPVRREGLAGALGIPVCPWTLPTAPVPATGAQQTVPHSLLSRAAALAMAADGGPRGFRLPLPRSGRLAFLRGQRGRRLVSVAALVLLGAGIIWGLRLHLLHRTAQGLDQEMAGLLRTTFPATGRVVDPLQQFQTQVQAARTTGNTMPELTNQRRALNTLAALSRILAQDGTTHLGSFALERDLVQLRGEAASYRAVQNLRDRLAATPGFAEAVIVSAGASGSGGGRVAFQLKFLLRPVP